MPKNETPRRVPKTEATDSHEVAKRLAMNIRKLIEDGHRIDEAVRFDRAAKRFFCKKFLRDEVQRELDKLNLELAETLRFYDVAEISDEVKEEMGKLADQKRIDGDLNLNRS